MEKQWSWKFEEYKDLSSLALDELIGNLKVHEVVMEKDSEIYKGKKERIKSITLKAKKESSDDETSTSRIEESLNVTFDESPPPTKLSPLVDDDVGEEEAIRKNTKRRQDFSRDNANNADFSKPDFLLHKAHLSLKLDYLLLWHITQTFRGAFGLGGSNKGVRLVGAVTATKGRSVGGSHQQPPYGTFSIVAAKGGVCLGLASS
ncbi:hypothetical protein Tco_1068372 [Tanacetum coccineum]|uniref:UBN2 domain-containing protein n=1 Tax=Tanacetum coccineum TaxID=301880 RepID=A0ABQ5HHF7_9ASTR